MVKCGTRFFNDLKNTGAHTRRSRIFYRIFFRFFGDRRTKTRRYSLWWPGTSLSIIPNRLTHQRLLSCVGRHVHDYLIEPAAGGHTRLLHQALKAAGGQFGSRTAGS